MKRENQNEGRQANKGAWSESENAQEEGTLQEQTITPLQEGAKMAPGIYQALANVCKSIGHVEKNQQCEGAARYKYRGIDDVYNAIHNALGANGIFILPHVIDRRNSQRETVKGRVMEYVLLRVRYEFCHVDGSKVACEVIGEAMDSGDKGTNKAMAIAHKYALLQMFCIPTQDMPDPDAESIELAPQNKDAWREDFRGFLNQQFRGNQKAIRDSLSSFFERPVRSMDALTRDEADTFMDACLHEG